MALVCIIGMHRSGTSLAARLLNIAGAYLGDDDNLVPADESNPAGYWENTHFHGFNERILNEFGGAWYIPPVLPDGWLDNEKVVGWRRDAADIVSARYAGHDVWAWKEPRTTLLLPFWRQVVPDAMFWTCVRNPIDVAASLAKRDTFSFEHSVAIWHIYTLRALQESAGAPVVLTHYEDLMADTRASLSPVLEMAGLTERMSDEQWTEILQFTNAELTHHRHTLDDVENDRRVPATTRAFYRALREGYPDGVQAAVEEAAAGEPILRNIIDREDRFARLTAERNELQAANDRLRQELRDKQQALEFAESVLSTRSHQMATRIAQLLARKPAAPGE
ncbi:MAG: sulfotransferase family protein [Capsulimonadaceae bacterium]